MIELWEVTREYQEITSLSIPEGGDAIPDILDEAMWNLDLFRRLQQADGGVRGGIESGEHPRYGDGSWGESLPVYAYGADAWTSWEYAAAATKLSKALQAYDAAEAAVWRDSAIRAMTWAEANVPTGDAYDQTHVNSRNLAAAELYDLTGANRWHNVFKATTSYDGSVYDVQWFEQQFEAAFVYARSARAGADDAIQATAREALLREADFYATTGNLGAFGSSINPFAPYGWGTSAVTMEEAADIFLRAHALTGDDRWLAEAMSDAQYALGANPLNMSYLIGLGGREPRRILNVDAETMGSGPPPGITVNGDYSVFDHGWNWFHTVMAGDVWPDYYQAPVSESFQSFEFFAAAAEYTVMQTMDSLMFVTGYLAAQGMEDAIRGGAGDEVLRGTGRGDIVIGDPGADSLYGGGGDDRLAGGDDDDLVAGGRAAIHCSAALGRTCFPAERAMTCFPGARAMTGCPEGRAATACWAARGRTP
jgi:endoglucanase